MTCLSYLRSLVFLHNFQVLIEFIFLYADPTARSDKVPAGERLDLIPPRGYLPRLTSLLSLPARPRGSSSSYSSGDSAVAVEGPSLLRVEDGTTLLVYVRGVAFLDPFFWFVYAVRDVEFGSALAVVSHTAIAFAESVAASLAPLIATP